jgi:ATP-dependent DNA helicase RecG
LIWGIEEETQRILGTTFNPDANTKGRQVFIMRLSQMLTPRIPFTFRKVNHPQGDLILLEITAIHTTL